uniref:Uncharacterized protein n=1 Tax=Arundo donax TaxID=35708 RepID=A0A0A9C141_ARUDO
MQVNNVTVELKHLAWSADLNCGIATVHGQLAHADNFVVFQNARNQKSFMHNMAKIFLCTNNEKCTQIATQHLRGEISFTARRGL